MQIICPVVKKKFCEQYPTGKILSSAWPLYLLIIAGQGFTAIRPREGKSSPRMTYEAVEAFGSVSGLQSNIATKTLSPRSYRYQNGLLIKTVLNEEKK